MVFITEEKLLSWTKPASDSEGNKMRFNNCQYQELHSKL